jgi:hypothetical protein
MLAMLNPRQDLALDCTVALEFVGDNDSRHVATAFTDRSINI